MALNEYGKLPDIAGTFSGRARVCGSGRCLWDDMSRVDGDIIAVNFAALHIPEPITHVYSDHAEFMFPIKLLRVNSLRGNPSGAFISHSSNDNGHADHVWPWPRHGTSSLGAVYTALALGYDEVFLCGVPMDNSGHFYDPPNGKTNFEQQCPETGPKYWKNNPHFEGRVKPVSGRLVEILK